jgi:hypothetical protein
VTYCLFEVHDILKLFFNIFDTQRLSYIDPEEVKHFLLVLQDGDVKSNSKMGMELIDSLKEKGHLLS